MRQRNTDDKAPYTHAFLGRDRPDNYYGKKCRIIGRGAVPEVAWIQFDDGKRFLVQRRLLSRQ